MAESSSFLSPWEILPITQEKQTFRDISRKCIIKCMVCVLIRIASPRRFKCEHSSYHYFMEDRKDIPKLQYHLQSLSSKKHCSQYDGNYFRPRTYGLQREKTYFLICAPKDYSKQNVHWAVLGSRGCNISSCGPR